MLDGGLDLVPDAVCLAERHLGRKHQVKLDETLLSGAPGAEVVHLQDRRMRGREIGGPRLLESAPQMQRRDRPERAREMLGTYQRFADNPRARLAEFKYTRMGAWGEVVALDLRGEADRVHERPAPGVALGDDHRAFEAEQRRAAVVLPVGETAELFETTRQHRDAHAPSKAGLRHLEHALCGLREAFEGPHHDVAGEPVADDHVGIAGEDPFEKRHPLWGLRLFFVFDWREFGDEVRAIEAELPMVWTGMAGGPSSPS